MLRSRRVLKKVDVYELIYCKRAFISADFSLQKLLVRVLFCCLNRDETERICKLLFDRIRMHGSGMLANLNCSDMFSIATAYTSKQLRKTALSRTMIRVVGIAIEYVFDFLDSVSDNTATLHYTKHPMVFL